MITILAAVALLLAALPAAMYAINRRLLRPPPEPVGEPPMVSVLIPARDEEANIGEALAAALAGTGVAIEVIVLDDASSDRTAEIVRAVAAEDPRVRLEPSRPLPDGWAGKMHACRQLAELARGEILVFVDADVRLSPDAPRRLAAFLEASGAALASGVPRQLAGSWLEALIVPQIVFVLLGFLPLALMRRRPDPAFGAGCGQLMVARREAYLACGGHAGCRGTFHDGLNLPKVFRRAGLPTDLFDATEIAACRMYQGARATWQGFSKNALEGMAAPTRILPFSALLLGGQVLPWITLAGGGAARLLSLAALALVFGTALASARRFRGALAGALVHPLGVLALVAIQWYALLRALSGRSATWKGRAFEPPGAHPNDGRAP